MQVGNLVPRTDFAVEPIVVAPCGHAIHILFEERHLYYAFCLEMLRCYINTSLAHKRQNERTREATSEMSHEGTNQQIQKCSM